jgi:hypothetical protein
MSWSLFSQTAVTPVSWADSVLSALGAPQSAANKQSLIAWALLEGGGGQYNPLNTTLPESGASSLNGVGVENYTSWSQGVQATVATLEQSNFSGIAASLKSGSGIGSGDASELSSWSGGGYSSLSETWSKAASYLGGASAPLPGGSASSSSSSGSSSGSSGVGSLLDPLSALASALSTIATDFGDAVKDLDKVAKFFSELTMPSTWIRVGACFAGIAFFIAGFVVLAKSDAIFGKIEPVPIPI